MSVLGEPPKNEDPGSPSDGHVLAGHGVRTATALRESMALGLKSHVGNSELAQRLPFVEASVLTVPNLRLIENWRKVTPSPY